MRPSRFLALAALASCLAAQPALAQSGTEEKPPLSQKLDEALRGLLDKMQPALKDLRDMLEIFERIDGLEYYEKPRFLPNGDIIIRRRLEAPPWTPPSDEDEMGVKT